MAFRPSNVIINGVSYEPDNQMPVSLFSPTFQYGLNVFEGIRGYIAPDQSPHLFLLEKHLNRLSRSAWLLQMEFSSDSYAALKSETNQLLDECPPASDFYLKIMLGYLNEGSWSSTGPADRMLFWYPLASGRQLDHPRCVTAHLSSYQRIGNNSMPPQIKCGANYINSRLGTLSATAAGADLPLFLNEQGYVSESSGACVFRVDGDRIETPPIHSSILPSITRDFVLNTLGPNMTEYQFREVELTRWDLYSADEVFLVGTNAELLSIKNIDQYTIGRVEKSTYPVTSHLAREFFSRIFESK